MKNVISSLLIISLIFLSCKEENKEVEKEVSTTENSENGVSGSFMVKNDISKVNWTGSKPAGKHNGEIKIKSGKMSFNNGHLTAGEFTIDMNSINVMDLEGQQKMDLENHLKGTVEGKEDHFFNIKKYPESKFAIMSATKEGDKYFIKGELTIRDLTNAIEFSAHVNFGNDNNEVRLTTDEFKIDRTKWGIEFMSKSIIDDLKDKFIDDEIVLKVTLHAIKK